VKIYSKKFWENCYKTTWLSCESYFCLLFLLRRKDLIDECTLHYRGIKRGSYINGRSWEERRKSRVTLCRPDFEAFLAEHVDAFLPHETEKKRQTARAKEKFPAENFSQVKYKRCIRDAPDSFFVDQIRGEIVAPLALPKVCHLWLIHDRNINYTASCGRIFY